MLPHIQLQLAERFVRFFTGSVVNPSAMTEEFRLHALHLTSPDMVTKLVVHLFEKDLKPVYEFFTAALSTLYPNRTLTVPIYDGDDKRRPLTKKEADHETTKYVNILDITANGFWNILTFPPWELAPETSFRRSIMTIGTMNKAIFLAKPANLRAKYFPTMILIQFQPQQDMDMDEFNNLKSTIDMTTFGPALEQYLSSQQPPQQPPNEPTTADMLRTFNTELERIWTLIPMLELDVKQENHFLWKHGSDQPPIKILHKNKTDIQIAPDDINTTYDRAKANFTDAENDIYPDWQSWKDALRGLGFIDMAGESGKMKMNINLFEQLRTIAKVQLEQLTEEEEEEEQEQEAPPAASSAATNDDDDKDEDKDEEKEDDDDQ